MPLSDTDPRIEAMMIEGYRRMSPAEKGKRVDEMTEMVAQAAAAGIRQQHPGIDEREVRLRLASRWLDRELMIRAFGWDPEEHKG